MATLRPGRSSAVPRSIDSGYLQSKYVRLPLLAKHMIANHLQQKGFHRHTDIHQCSKSWFIDSHDLWKQAYLCRQWKYCPFCMEQRARSLANQFLENMILYVAERRVKTCRVACFMLRHVADNNRHALGEQVSLIPDYSKFFRRWHKEWNANITGENPHRKVIGPFAAGAHFKRNPSGNMTMHWHMMLGVHTQANVESIRADLQECIHREFMPENVSLAYSAPGKLLYDLPREYGQSSMKLTTDDLYQTRYRNDTWKKARYMFNFCNLKSYLNQFDTDAKAAANRLAIDLVSINNAVNNAEVRLSDHRFTATAEAKYQRPALYMTNKGHVSRLDRLDHNGNVIETKLSPSLADLQSRN